MKPNLKVCIHGMIGGTSGKNGRGSVLNVESLYQHFFQRIIEPNLQNYNVQVFIHSWSIEEKQRIVKSFKPENAIFENPKFNVKQRSKLYSLFKSIQMCKSQKDTSEDVILSCRFDMFYRKNVNVKDWISDINEYDSENRNAIVAPGDDPSWNGRPLNSLRVQDQFFAGYADTIIPHFSLENYTRVDNNINAKSILIRSPDPNPAGRKMDNHRVFRNIFENEKSLSEIVGDIGSRQIKSVLANLYQDPEELQKTLVIKILKSKSHVSEVDFEGARKHSQFH